jgi:hypothetical protein
MRQAIFFVCWQGFKESSSSAKSYCSDHSSWQSLRDSSWPVLDDAWGIQMSRASNTSSKSPWGWVFVTEPRFSETQILYSLHDLFLQYVQGIIKWLSSVNFLFRKCHHLHCPLLVISQPKIWWVIQFPLNHNSCKYLFPWEKAAPESFQ